MYKLLLILRYLRRKLAPLFALLAVTLCTAMVIIVISIMGGFLELMRDSARKLSSDVSVFADLSGFPHYETLIERLEGLPDVLAATPVAHGYGLVKVFDQVHTVEVLGVDPDGLDRVTAYAGSLYWTNKHLREGLEIGGPTEGGDADLDAATRAELEKRRAYYEQLEPRRYGMTFEPPPQWNDPQRPMPGVVPGIEISPYNRRDEEGRYSVWNSSLGHRMTLTVVPVTRQGGLLEPAVREMVVVNEFKSGLYEIDAKQVYVPFDMLQRMLRMDAYERVDPETGEATGEVEPARASRILVRGEAGTNVDLLADAVFGVVDGFVDETPGMAPLRVVTWEQQHATFLGAVKKEKFLLTILFGIISVVAVAMIGVIFYMIVMEKTRDIGVLRAIGASRTGIASIFLGYGLAIGMLGAGLGFGLAAVIVWNINEIQTFLGEQIGFKMWDPRIYYFEKIPSQLDPTEVSVIVIIAVLSSVLGSLVPSILAARQNPVDALRYE